MNRSDPDVLVLLPVYNGERFLRQQLDSILSQDCNFRLLVHDDGSQDGSLFILKEYAARFPAEITLLQDTPGNLGACAAFALLMRHALFSLQASSRPVWVALADQDDIWHPQRLSSGVTVMQQAEAGRSWHPVLVHSDLRLIDARGEDIAPSLMRYQGLNPHGTCFSKQILVNTVTGCTVLMNAALLQRALPIPEQAMMHDWWLSLVASCFGSILYIERPLVSYRQHASNTLGARRYTRPGFNRATLRKLLQCRSDEQEQSLIRARAEQATAFEGRYGEELGDRERKAIELVCRMPDMGLWRQRLLQRRLIHGWFG